MGSTKVTVRSPTANGGLVRSGVAGGLEPVVVDELEAVVVPEVEAVAVPEVEAVVIDELEVVDVLDAVGVGRLEEVVANVVAGSPVGTVSA